MDVDVDVVLLTVAVAVVVAKCGRKSSGLGTAGAKRNHNNL